MKRGGGVQRVEEAGVPHEALLQSKRGGHIEKRDLGGPTGMPAAAPVLLLAGCRLVRALACRRTRRS